MQAERRVPDTSPWLPIALGAILAAVGGSFLFPGGPLIAIFLSAVARRRAPTRALTKFAVVLAWVALVVHLLVLAGIIPAPRSFLWMAPGTSPQDLAPASA